MTSIKPTPNKPPEAPAPKPPAPPAAAKGSEAARMLADCIDSGVYGMRDALLDAYDQADTEWHYSLARILDAVDRVGEHGSARVGEHAHVGLTEASRAVAQLVELGMVARTPVDLKGKKRRGTPTARLKVTPAGRERLKQLRKVWTKTSGRLLTMIEEVTTPSERIAFARVLSAISARLGGRR